MVEEEEKKAWGGVLMAKERGRYIWDKNDMPVVPVVALLSI